MNQDLLIQYTYNFNKKINIKSFLKGQYKIYFKYYESMMKRINANNISTVQISILDHYLLQILEEIYEANQELYNIKNENVNKKLLIDELIDTTMYIGSTISIFTDSVSDDTIRLFIKSFNNRIISFIDDKNIIDDKNKCIISDSLLHDKLYNYLNNELNNSLFKLRRYYPERKWHNDFNPYTSIAIDNYLYPYHNTNKIIDNYDYILNRNKVSTYILLNELGNIFAYNYLLCKFDIDMLTNNFDKKIKRVDNNFN